MAEYTIIKFLSSIFTPGLNLSSTLPFMNTAAELLGDKLNGNPVSLPFDQPDAPAMIPRLQFPSVDKKWNLTVSLQRTDLVYLNKSLADDRPNIKEFSAIAGDFMHGFKRKLDLHVQRVAFVTERVAPGKEPASSIIAKYCKREYAEEGRPFHNAKKFEIHAYKRYDWEKFSLNSWVRLRAIDFKDGDRLIPVFFMENDLNTLSESEDPQREFSAEEIQRYFTNAPSEIEEIVRKYLE